MPGNVYPCGNVSLGEVINAINQWANSFMGLQGVIDLINSWADPVKYPPI